MRPQVFRSLSALPCRPFPQVLTIPLEIPAAASTSPDLLLPRCLRYLSSASAFAAVNGPAAGSSAWLPAVFLRLLVTWLNDCPPAVAAFLASPAHLPLVGEAALSPKTMIRQSSSDGLDNHAIVFLLKLSR